jgi:hypothetical protein
LLIAVCVFAAGGGLAAAVTVPVPQEKAAALQRLVSVATTDSNTEPAVPPDSAAQPIPARMLGSDVPVPIAPSVLRVRNGWLVSDGRTLVAVYAGAAGHDSSVGRLMIVRQDLIAGTQTVRTLDAGPTGALTITTAPLGSSVETTGQTGSIRLRTAGGQALRLDLGTGTVAAVDAPSLTRPSRTGGTVRRPWRPRSSDSASYSFGR